MELSSVEIARESRQLITRFSQLCPPKIPNYSTLTASYIAQMVSQTLPGLLSSELWQQCHSTSANIMGTVAGRSGVGHMHELDSVPSFLGKPVESVGQGASVLQKIERVTAHE